MIIKVNYKKTDYTECINFDYKYICISQKPFLLKLGYSCLFNEIEQRRSEWS